MCLNETYGTVRVGKHLSDLFAIMNGLKQGDSLRKVQTNDEILHLSLHITFWLHTYYKEKYRSFSSRE
jgi:hypothetical protein